MKNRYIVTIYSGLSFNKNVNDIKKDLYKQTEKQQKEGKATSKNMLAIALKTTSTLKKKIGNKSFVEGYVKTTYLKKVDDIIPIEVIAIFVYDLLKKYKVEKKLSHEINVEADKTEGTLKVEGIEGAINYNRDLKSPRVFYLASQHKDSASDHEPWQGKMYVDEKWKSVIQDKDLKEQIGKYIQENDVRTVQWVTGKPVWFITRPNCRHYFQSMTVEEVLTKSRTQLLKDHNMTRAIGNREYLQTIKHARNKNWYQDVRNAEIILGKYQDRLKLHQDLYNARPNTLIKEAIAKDKMLIEKWKKFIYEKTKGH